MKPSAETNINSKMLRIMKIQFPVDEWMKNILKMLHSMSVLLNAGAVIVLSPSTNHSPSEIWVWTNPVGSEAGFRSDAPLWL